MEMVDQARVATPVPASARTVGWLVWAIIALGGLTVLLTALLRGQLVRSWSEGKADDLPVPAFVPVALVLFVVVAALGWLLLVFFRHGHAWARWALAALVVFVAFSSAIGLGRNLPAAFAALAAVSLLINLALLVALFHRDTNAFVRAA